MKSTMNWNAKPESVTLPPLYPKNQSSFLDPSLINTPSQSSLNYPGGNQEACMFLSHSNPISQPLLNFRNYKTPQQISVSDMHSGTFVASQTSVERTAYANGKGPKQPNHNLQMASGVWSNSPVRNSMLSHTGTAVSQQTGFGTNTPKVHAPQNQFVTPDSYSMQVQMIPSNSVRVPVTYQGNPGLNSSLSERQGDWAQQYTSNGLTHQDYRLPKQYIYSSQNLLKDPTLQKQHPVPLMSLQVKDNHPPNSALSLPSKQTATVQSYQYAVNQIDKRLPPPPPPYDCRYVSQPLQSTQHVIKHSPMEVPQSQETHLPEMRKDFGRGFQQHWQNLNENASTVGTFCNLKVNTNVSQPFNEPIRSSVDGVQILAQNNQEVRADSCNLTSNPALDTSATKEKLVRDIKTLVEMKKKFSELARKVKIDKDLLTAAGCIKTTKTSYSESAKNSELSLKHSAKIQSGPQVTLVTSETSQDKPPTVMETAEETNRTQSTLNFNIQDTNCRNFSEVNSILLNPVCSEKLSVPDKLHDLKVMTSLQISTDGRTHGISNNTQFSSGKFVNVEENMPTKPETTSVTQSTAFEDYALKYINKNRLLLSLLAHGDKVEEKLLKGAHESIQDSKPHHFEMNPNTQISGNQQNLKTLETPSACNTNGKISDSSFCLECKSSTHGLSSKSGSHCSMELLTTCLSLWKKQPSEPTEKKQCNESSTNRTTVGISKPVDICDKSTSSFVGNSQNKMVNSSQTTLSMVVQNYESPGATGTKGTELQVAVVSPLVLSDVKTLSVKGITSEDLSETMYPVIKEGSVHSLQNQLAENSSVTTALKVNVNEAVASTTSTKIFPLIQNDKQNESTKGNSESTPNTSQGNCIKWEPDIHYPESDQQASYKSRDSDTVNSDMLQIDSICSLVEGDLSYNSQIAKIFNSPVKKVEPQKSLPNHQVISSKQIEQLDSITVKKDFGFQKDNCVQFTDVSHEIPDQSNSPQPPESNSEILEKSSLEHITKMESRASMCSSAAIQQDSNSQEIDVSCDYSAQNPARNEILDKTPILYLHDQLSELLKEFPYGIEPVNTHEVSVAQQTDQDSEDQTCDKTSCDSKDSPDQIQITILNSEQMKELFPEQDDQPIEVDELIEPQKAKPITKEESQCDLQVHTDRENHDSIVDSEKDDVRCCALGWLSMVYEGVPQCQCNSIKNSTLKEEKGTDHCSPLETNNCKQGESTSDRDVLAGLSSPPNNNPKIALTFPGGNNDFPEIEQSKTIKDTSQTKHNSLLKTEEELRGQSSSKGDKNLNSLQSHKNKRKRKLKFHEVTFHSSNKIKFSQESLQRKAIAQNPHPLKAKTGFLTNKNKDLHMKNGSLVQSILPEKRKLKAGHTEQKVAEKRKSDKGSILDSEIKRMKYDKQEQKKRGGTFKISNFLSTPSERAKEKIVSNIKSSGSKHSSYKINGVPSQKEYLQRQKHKEAMGSKTLKKNTPCDSQYIKSSKLSPQVGSYGKSNERPSSSVQTSKESNICASLGKNLKIHHSKESKTHFSRNVKATVGGKQPDKMWVEKTNLEKNVNINNEIEFTQMSSQAKEPAKQYLNRVTFKCTERESICITEFGSFPRKVNKEKRRESKTKSLLPKKDATEKRSMLQFKLCPDGLINKSTNSTQDQKDLQPCPRKEQASVQGIKSTKEDWLKGTPEEKRIPEANQETDDKVLTNSRIAKRSCSADGCETLQNPVKDSKSMFQTYKKMYMEKRSRSLGSSPLK